MVLLELEVEELDTELVLLAVVVVLLPVLVVPLVLLPLLVAVLVVLVTLDSDRVKPRILAAPKILPSCLCLMTKWSWRTARTGVSQGHVALYLLIWNVNHANCSVKA